MQNKLYVWAKHADDSVELERIVVPGDKFDFIVYWVENNDTFVERTCSNVIVESVDENYEILYATDGREFDLDKITFFMASEPTAKLHYGLAEIVDDFYDILSKEEKQEFQHKTVDELFEKYHWPIVNRSWMCREEHDFITKYPDLSTIRDNGNHEHVFEVVRRVIGEITKRCNNCS